jgi:WD40 repeat protein
MQDCKSATRAGTPRLPWFGTVIFLVAVMVAALVKPLMPHGIVEYALRQAGRPLSIDMGHGRSLRLEEEPPVLAGCQASDIAWRPDGKVLVTACSQELQAWTLDGSEIGKGPAMWPFSQHMQVLADPFRLAYFGRSGDAGVRRPVLTLWDVQAGVASTLPDQLSALDNFVVDQDHAQVAVTHMSRPGWELRILSLDRKEVTLTLQIPTAANALCWLPGSRALLLGGYDGVLRRVDITTGDIRELARPYTTAFPTGGGTSAMVDGLVLSPDGKSVAIFQTGGVITPDPGTGKIDVVAEQKWHATLGTTVEIRSVDDGRLLDRMPGPEAGVVGLVWDPMNRFIAVATRNALILWQRQSGALVVRTYGDPGILHRLSITNDGTRLGLTTARGVRIFRIKEM